VLNCVFASCRWHIIDDQHILKKKNKPLLVCCWHSRSLFVARYFKYQKIISWGISSTHRDSEILARILRSWQINLIRGSSTRGWVRVLKKMILLFKKPSTIITVTSDGPRGPKKIPKMGSIDVAHKYGAQIIAASGLSSRYWTLPTWDQTKIPKPFSTIYIVFSSPYRGSSAPTAPEMKTFIDKNQQDLSRAINQAQ